MLQTVSNRVSPFSTHFTNQKHQNFRTNYDYQGNNGIALSPPVDFFQSSMFAHPPPPLFSFSPFQRHCSFDSSSTEFNSPISKIPSSELQLPFFEEIATSKEKYSRKVFIGGLPQDIDMDQLLIKFGHFGTVSVDWPHKEMLGSRFPPQGYAFLCFEHESSVLRLLFDCSLVHGKYYTFLDGTSIRHKLVQLRPWALSDAEFRPQFRHLADHRLTVFIGGVPRPTTAGRRPSKDHICMFMSTAEVTLLMDKTFSSVLYVSIEVDAEFQYPKGAAKVTFASRNAYIEAIRTRFIIFKNGDGNKQAEIKPYLVETVLCDHCLISSTGLFCASVRCLRYLCDPCWRLRHSLPSFECHKPMVKSSTDRGRQRMVSGGKSNNF